MSKTGPVEQATASLCRSLPGRIAGVAVFGSYALDDQRPDSDLDLAILPSSSLDPVEVWDLAQEIATQLHVDVDVVDLWRASTVLQHQVVTKGRWVYTRDENACAFFEANTLTRYCHLNDERREILSDVGRYLRTGEDPGG